MKRREKKVNKKRCQRLQKITTTELKRETEMNSLEKLGKTERTERERKKRGRKIELTKAQMLWGEKENQKGLTIDVRRVSVT